MDTKPTTNDVTRIEGMIRDLNGNSDSPNGYMREHLEQARFYLLGSMPQEYGLSLKLARELLPEIKDENLKNRIAGFLDEQQNSVSMAPEM